MESRAKIIATLGPSSHEKGVITSLINAGMNVARLNFSHGTHAEHESRIANLRAASSEMNRPIAIMQDLQGPKLRVGLLAEPIELAVGQGIVLSQADKSGDEDRLIPVDFIGMLSSMKAGERILVNDGRIELIVEQVDTASIHAKVSVGGELSSHKGINLPGKQLDIAAFTDKDADDLSFGLEQGVDAVALSFVRNAEDVLLLKSEITQRVKERRSLPLIIAKLERPESLQHLDGILEAADGVMVARGDLGVEMPPEEVPAAQKHIIQEANQRGKLVITATQMLESMMHNPLPTRAEASDVANAVFDGTDALMLSGETAVGGYPVASVNMMSKIIQQAEAGFGSWGHSADIEDCYFDDAISLSMAARELAYDRDVAAIAVFTQSGRTARMMAKARPHVPILAFTPEEKTYNQLSFVWGVKAHRIAFVNSVERMFDLVEKALPKTGIVRKGQQVVLVCGFPVGEMRPPNMVLLHEVA